MNDIESRIKDNLYEPINWQKSLGYKRSDKYCAYSCHEQGRGVGFVQCQRKPKEEIGGYKWCSQHAKKIKGINPKPRPRKLDALDLNYNWGIGAAKNIIYTLIDEWEAAHNGKVAFGTKWRETLAERLNAEMRKADS